MAIGSGAHTLGAISKVVLGSGYNGILEESAEGSDLYIFEQLCDFALSQLTPALLSSNSAYIR